MPTYLYFCEECNCEFEEVHSINAKLDECPKCKEAGKEPKEPRRLISSGATFILTGGGWANSGYS